MKKLVACLIILAIAACVALGITLSKNGNLSKQLSGVRASLTESETASSP